MRLMTFSGATALVATLVLACGGHDDAAGPPIPVDDLAHVMADAFCNHIGPCCQKEGFPHDAAKCMEGEAELNKEFARRRSSRATYDGAAARTCVDGYLSATQSCSTLGAVLKVCQSIFTGTVPIGEACNDRDECVPQARCDSPLGSAPGQCVSGTSGRGTPGEACSATCTEDEASSVTSCAGNGGHPGTATCYTNDGLVCDVNGACSTLPRIGQPCPDFSPCEGEAFCEGNICVAKRTSGPCSGSIDDACAKVAYCDLTTRTCAPRKATGESCNLPRDCLPSDDCLAGICHTRSIATPSTCTKP